jgi:hypothetical protein
MLSGASAAKDGDGMGGAPALLPASAAVAVPFCGQAPPLMPSAASTRWRAGGSNKSRSCSSNSTFQKVASWTLAVLVVVVVVVAVLVVVVVVVVVAARR